MRCLRFVVFIPIFNANRRNNRAVYRRPRSRTRAIPRKPRHRRLKQVSIDLFVALGRLKCGVMEAEVMKPRTTIYLLGGRADHFRSGSKKEGQKVDNAKVVLFPPQNWPSRSKERGATEKSAR